MHIVRVLSKVCWAVLVGHVKGAPWCPWCRQPATHCRSLQHAATHCSILQDTARHCKALQHTAAHYSTLHHTTTHCNTPQYTTSHCNTLHHTKSHNDAKQRTESHCSTLQHTVTLYKELRGSFDATCERGLVTFERLMSHVWVRHHENIRILGGFFSNVCRTLLLWHVRGVSWCPWCQHSATHCITVQYTAWHYKESPCSFAATHQRGACLWLWYLDFWCPICDASIVDVFTCDFFKSDASIVGSICDVSICDVSIFMAPSIDRHVFDAPVNASCHISQWAMPIYTYDTYMFCVWVCERGVRWSLGAFHLWGLHP